MKFYKRMMFWLLAAGMTVTAEGQSYRNAREKPLALAVQDINGWYPVPISVMYLPRAKADAITVGYALNVLGKQPAESLSKEERSYLSTAQMIAQHDPKTDLDSVIAYRERLYDTLYRDAHSAQECLKQLVAQDPRYKLVAEDGRYVIVPSDPKYTAEKFDFKVEAMAPDKAYAALAKQVLTPRGLEWFQGINISGNFGPDSPELRDWGIPGVKGNKAPVTLDLKQVDIVTLMERFCAALSPHVSWVMQFAPDDERIGTVSLTQPAIFNRATNLAALGSPAPGAGVPNANWEIHLGPSSSLLRSADIDAGSLTAAKPSP
jgi:hypothetical protein